MEAVSGVFKTRVAAERAVHEAAKAGIPADRITLLTPGSVDHLEKEMQSVPTDTAEQPGMGKAIGALLGGGVGITGGSLLIALVPGVGPITALGLLGAAAGDAAREQWWIGLRSAEESHYSKSGNNFADDEKFYRLGFQAALHAKTRCMEFDQVSGEMNAALEEVQRENPGVDVEEAFTRGYQRGRDYYQQL